MDTGAAAARLSIVRPGLDRAGAIALCDRARGAGAAWARRSIAERLRVLAAFRAALAGNPLDLAARVDRRPPGETLSGEILPLLAACRWLEREAPRLLAPARRGRAAPWFGGARLRVGREPRGVVLVVGPSNYGLMLPGIQCLQALAAGNAVIVKPAPGTRDVLWEFAERLKAGGLPDGLLTVVDESTASATALIAAPVDLLVFTGSARAGRAVLDAAAAAFVPAILELSGWDACLVLDSADVERTAEAIAFALRFNRGETCLAPRRILVSRAVHATLIRRLSGLLAAGGRRSFAPGIRAEAARAVAGAIDAGATLAAGRLTADGIEGPLLLTGVTAAMPVFASEVFGPIALVTEVESIAEAIALANAVPSRLGATVFGDVTEAEDVAKALDAGVVMLNDAVVPAAHPALPIAARGASGFGVTRGPEGLLALTRPKAIAVAPRRRPLHLRGTGDADPALLAALIGVAYGRGLRFRIRAVLAALRAALGGRQQEKSACR